MEVNIQIERRSKTLDQGDRARLGHLVGMARFLDQVRGNDAESFLPDMLINFALINITDRKNEGTNTIDGNWQADERRRYRDNVRIYF